MKKNHYLELLILLLSLSVLWGCEKKGELEDSAESKSKKNYTLKQQLEDMRGIKGKVEVPVVTVTTGAISSYLSVTGELVPRRSVIVKPQMEGRIQFVHPIKVGDIVKDEELIARIDDRDIEDEITQQKRQIEISRETLNLDENELAQREKDLEFDRQLLGEGFLNESEFRKSELALKRAQVSLRKSRLQLEQEENKLQKVMRQREKVPIKAPIGGMVVLSRHLTNQGGGSGLLNEEIMSLDGTLVNTGTQLFGIVSQDDFLAQCLVNGKDKAKIQIGQKCRVTVITHRAVEVPGEVAKVDQLQDVKSHAYKVWIKLDRVDKSFTSGLFVRSEIELDRSENAIVVPKQYLKERDNRSFVQLVRNDKVVDVMVERGIQQGDRIELVKGVDKGDVLIASEKVMASDQLIKPVEKAPEEE